MNPDRSDLKLLKSVFRYVVWSTTSFVKLPWVIEGIIFVPSSYILSLNRFILAYSVKVSDKMIPVGDSFISDQSYFARSNACLVIDELRI